MAELFSHGGRLPPILLNIMQIHKKDVTSSPQTNQENL